MAASGINEEKVNALNVELLDAIEDLKVISNRLDTCAETIRRNLDGHGKNSMLSKISMLKQQLPTISSNISNYIDELGKVVRIYRRSDIDAAHSLNSSISKLDERRG